MHSSSMTLQPLYQTPVPNPDETMRQLRVAVRTAMGGRTLRRAADLAGVSENTLARILRGENVTFLTAARICANLGACLVVRVEQKRNM